MIDITRHKVSGIEDAIRGMRNPMNSWEKSDSFFEYDDYLDEFIFALGENDRKLAFQLSKNGSVHAKYRRMITVWCDITAPLYWWKEFETYRAGVIPNPFDIEMNSCSTMHKLMAKPFDISDFSSDYLLSNCTIYENEDYFTAEDCLYENVYILNEFRKKYLETKDKKYWYTIIQLLPSSYNQKRTLMLNYEALAHIYHDRKDHKLDEWRNFCKWIETLPYSELITLKEDNKKEEK